jgi:hypothetical protein
MEGMTISQQFDACKEKLDKLLKKVEYNAISQNRKKQIQKPIRENLDEESSDGLLRN